MLICGRDCTNVYGPRHPRPVTVFPSVVSEAEMYQRDDTCTGQQPVILYTGMLRPAKRLETLIDAAGLLIAEGRQLRLRLVGYAEPHDYLADVAAAGNAAGLQESVEFVGYVPLGDPLNREYRGADIYAFPSLHEGAARTLLEAASQSLPLVMTDVGSARDLFADGESALIVPPDDPAAMARAIARYLDEPDLRRRCIRNGHTMARSRSLEKFMDEMTEHLRQAQRRAAGGRHQSMKGHAALLWQWLVRLATCWLPESWLTMRFRGWLLGLAMKHRGKDFQVASGVLINRLDNVSVGDHVILASGVVLLAALQITIEDEVLVAHHTVITDGNHTFEGGSFRFGPRRNRPVVIGHGAWIGANCTVLPGVTIGRGALVAANSAVSKDVPDGCVVGGVPAKVIRMVGE